MITYSKKLFFRFTGLFFSFFLILLLCLILFWFYEINMVLLIILPIVIIGIYSGLAYYFIYLYRKEQHLLPKTEIDLQFLANLVNSHNDLLLVYNDEFNIIWTNNQSKLRQLLSLKKSKSVYGTALKDLLPSAFMHNFPNNAAQQKFICLNREKKGEYFLVTLLKKYSLLILKPHNKIWELKSFIENQRPVFLVLELDENYLDDKNKSKDSKKFLAIDAYVQLAITDFLHDREGILLESDEKEYRILLPYKYLKESVEDKFTFIDDLKQNIKQKYKIEVTFSGGAFLPKDTNTQTEELLNIDSFQLDNLYIKSIEAKQKAKTRGGDQILVVKFDDRIEVFGERRQIKTDILNLTKKYSVFESTIKPYKNILIIGHSEPDYDAIASGLGVKIWVENKFTNKNVNLIMPTIGEVLKQNVIELIEQENYERHITESFDFNQWKKSLGKKLIIIVDTNEPEYVDFRAEEIAQFDKVIFDHHTPLYKFNNVVLDCIDSTASSASEIILGLYDWTERPQPPSSKFSPCFLFKILLFGVLADTNNLQNNLGPNSLSIFNNASKEKDIQVQDLINKFKKFKQIVTNGSGNQNREFKVTSFANDTIVLFDTDKNAGQHETAIDLEKYLSNNFANTAILVRGDGNKKGKVFVSIRSTPKGINAAVIAEKLGGGGDYQRAAAQLTNSQADIVLKQVKKIVKDIQSKK